MKGIVVTTSEYTKYFLPECLDSLKAVPYPVLIVSNGGFKPEYIGEGSLIINDWNGWELGGIQRGKEKFEEFVHIMDTSVVKDISLFDKLFAIEGNVALTKDHFHYMGKYVSKLLPNTPRIHEKSVGILMETTWLDKSKNYSEFYEDLPVHTNNFININGQKRMVLENSFIIKYKGTWVRSAEHP